MWSFIKFPLLFLIPYIYIIGQYFVKIFIPFLIPFANKKGIF